MMHLASRTGTIDHLALRSALTEARRHAKRLDARIMTTYTLQVTACNLPGLLSTNINSSKYATYWEHPASGIAMMGMGTAATLANDSYSPIVDIAKQWKTLQANAFTTEQDGSSPLLLALGGFVFDPANTRTELWNGFPAGMLTIPRMLLRADNSQTTLTLAASVAATTDCDDLAIMLETDAQQLLNECNNINNRQVIYTELQDTDMISSDEWCAAVAATVADIQAHQYKKVVLARGISVQATGDLSPTTALQRLRQRYPSAYLFAHQIGQKTFLGATPELLACIEEHTLYTMALAGSAPRGTTTDEDAYLGTDMLNSAKNRHEHALVVDSIRQSLAPLTTDLSMPGEPRLLRLPNVQHLQTPIQGRLDSRYTLLDVVAALHPTPAVGGMPRHTAMEIIRQRERLDRGWYAGPVGWIDNMGNGEFAVALRSALVEGNQATLFAGCGIVGDSDPQAEYQESCLKMQAMLHALGGEPTNAAS
jgi:isochorismate synthase